MLEISAMRQGQLCASQGDFPSSAPGDCQGKHLRVMLPLEGRQVQCKGPTLEPGAPPNPLPLPPDQLIKANSFMFLNLSFLTQTLQNH